MKTIITSIFPFIIFSFVLFGIETSKQCLANKSFGFDPETCVNVTVDPRIELLAIVQLLSDYRGFGGRSIMTQLEFPYKRVALEYFSPFKNHKVVELFTTMSKKGFWYSHPPHAMLYFSNPPELEQNLPIDTFVIKMAGGKEYLERFIVQMRLFAQESNFTKFFQNHTSTYQDIIKSYKGKTDRNYIKDIEHYFGYNQNSYTIILAPFFFQGGYGPKIWVKEGIYDVFNLIGPRKVINNNPDFGTEQEVLRSVWHEFSHSFINPLVHSHLNRFMDPCTILLTSKKKEVESIGMTWEDYIWEWVSEHIVRGIATRSAYKYFGKEYGDTRLAKEINQGFPYIKEICNSLQQYEEQRDQFPTFKEYLPEIIKVFNKLVKKSEVNQKL